MEWASLSSPTTKQLALSKHSALQQQTLFEEPLPDFLSQKRRAKWSLLDREEVAFFSNVHVYRRRFESEKFET